MFFDFGCLVVGLVFEIGGGKIYFIRLILAAKVRGIMCFLIGRDEDGSVFL